ncbi:hypothetical protein [Nioella aestuarii]|uniref:hypothetical protein n=1 Tax=Nioella aestuarii TaxID=1662864 RepID=UPI003D7FA560
MSTPDPTLASALLVLLEGEAGFAEPDLTDIARAEVAERLAAGAEVNGWYEGRTLLSHAVGWKRADFVETLLEHGARINDPTEGPDVRFAPCTVAAETDEPEIVRLLARHGAKFADFDREVMSIAIGSDRIPAQRIDPKDVPRLAPVTRGTRNPSAFDNPFYLEMIRSFDSAYAGMKTHSSATRASWGPGPIFSFDRFGRTVTRLPDGRLVLIAGEHEDHYDPDFCIYNDVCVLDGKGGVEYFTYPVDDFPPTDFHTATLMEDHILIIGCLGYPKQRQEGVTQVLRLDLRTWRVTPVQTTGDNPGWIHRHEAELIHDEIVVSGGKVEPGYQTFDGVHALDPRKMRWRKIS